MTLGSSAKLTDSATLSGGYSPTGAITFRLFAPDGTTVVHTESVTVSGNGMYSTPTGYVPTVAGTYQWVAAYAGDGNNNATSTNLGDEPEKAVNDPLATSLSVAAATGSFGGTTTLQATLTYGNGSGVGQDDHLHAQRQRLRGQRGHHQRQRRGHPEQRQPRWHQCRPVPDGRWRQLRGRYHRRTEQRQQ